MGHKTFPCLLRGVTIEMPDPAWVADMTYVPSGRGSLYPVAIMDWASRAVLARRSNRMVLSFRVSALRRHALVRFGKPSIFNTDQGGQFISETSTGTLLTAAIKVSMDGRGRWLDSMLLEPLWRS